MRNSEHLAAVREISARAASVPATHVNSQAVLGFLLGALYALTRAIQLDFRDRTGPNLDRSYPQELADLLADLSGGELPRTGQWLAGFYFNTALQKLAALYHRGLQLITKSKGSAAKLAEHAIREGQLPGDAIDAIATIHKEVNRLKHDPFGVLEGRKVDTELSLRAASEALALALAATRPVAFYGRR